MSIKNGYYKPNVKAKTCSVFIKSDEHQEQM